jgi:hypothetical protein
MFDIDNYISANWLFLTLWKQLMWLMCHLAALE